MEAHLLDTARHLVDLNADPADCRTRFARVTRVHILSLLRTTGNGRFSKWYRESHYIHHVLTKQPPPDIGHLETTLMIMFGRGMFFFLTSW